MPGQQTATDYNTRKRELASQSFTAGIMKYAFIGLAVVGALALAAVGLNEIGGEALVIKGRQMLGITPQIGPNTAALLAHSLLTTIIGGIATAIGALGWRQTSLHQSDLQFRMEEVNAEMQASKISQALERSPTLQPDTQRVVEAMNPTKWQRYELQRRTAALNGPQNSL